MAQAPQTATERKAVDHLRGRVKATKHQLDWLHQYRRGDWEARRLAEIDAGLVLGRLAAAEGNR